MSLSAAAAVGAWRAARASNRTAREVAAIERVRRHVELTPQLTASIRPGNGGTFMVSIRLDAPYDLGALDRMTLFVRNDISDRSPSLGGEVTAEQVNDHIWGPLRFTPGVDGASGDGRRVGPVPLKVGDYARFQMDVTRAPVWAGPDGQKGWRAKYQTHGVPVLLSIICERDGDEAWTIPVELHPSGHELDAAAG